MTDVRCEEAAPNDIAEVVRLRRLAFEEVGVDASDPAWQAACAHELAAGLADKTVKAFVGRVVAEERLVASVIGLVVPRLPMPGNARGDHGYITSLYTSPRYRRRGIATALLHMTLEWFKGAGIYVVDVHPVPEAARLYRSFGFREPMLRELRWRQHPAGGVNS